MFIVLNYYYYNIIKFKKDITEKACLVVLHGLAGADDNNFDWSAAMLHYGGRYPSPFHYISWDHSQCPLVDKPHLASISSTWLAVAGCP